MPVIPTEEGDILFEQAGIDEWGRRRITLSFLDDGTFLLKPPVMVAIGGILAPASVTVKTVVALLVGILTSAATTRWFSTKELVAHLESAGQLVKSSAKNFVSVLDSIGVLSTLYNPAMAAVQLVASLGFAGTVDRLRALVFSGILTATASLEKITTRFLVGSLGFLSTVHRLATKVVSGVLFFGRVFGTFVRKIQMLYGTILPTGQIAKGLSYAISGILSLTGLPLGLSRIKNLIAQLSFEGYYGSKVHIYIERVLNFDVLFCRTANWFWVKVVRPTVTVCMTKLTRRDE